MTVLDSIEWTRCLAHGRRRAMSRPQRIRSLLTRLRTVQQTTFTAVDTEAHPTLGAEQASDSLRGGQGGARMSARKYLFGVGIALATAALVKDGLNGFLIVGGMVCLMIGSTSEGGCK